MKYNKKQRTFWHTFFLKDPKKHLMKDKKDLYWHIHDTKKRKTSDSFKSFHAIHFVLKYKIIVPGLKLLKWMFRKHLVHEIPNTSYNKNLYLLDKAFKMANEQFVKIYVMHGAEGTEEEKAKYMKEYMEESRSIDFLENMQTFIRTGIMYDTAAREYINMWMYCVYILMHNEHANRKELLHLMFIDTKFVNDPTFLMAQNKLDSIRPKQTKKPKLPTVRYLSPNDLIKDRNELMQYFKEVQKNKKK